MAPPRENARYLLEFTRSTHAAVDVTALPEGPQEYHVRGRDQGRPDVTTLDWSRELRDALDSVTDRGAGEVAARLGRTLARFVDVPCWTSVADEVASRARRTLTPLTIRSHAAELDLLPWELLTFPRNAPRHAGHLPKLLLRYEDADTPSVPLDPALSRAHRGRVVFAWSAAGGKVDAAKHVALLRESLAAAAPAFDPVAGLALDVIENASLAAIDACLRCAVTAGEPIAVLHLLCHGARGVGDDAGTSGLLLDREDGSGATDFVSPSRLQGLVSRYASAIGLVVIAACEGAHGGPVGHELESAARAVHRAGVRAVIASRALLSYEGCLSFAGSLYGAFLGELTTLEEAFVAARERLGLADSLDGLSLQLHARDADGDATRVFNARPYRGLAPYEPAHERLFFGRDAEVRELLGHLEHATRHGGPRLVVVAGASGTGKSSLVMAGAVPRWRASHPSGDHLVVRPGAAPDDALATLAKMRANRPSEGPLLVVVDQFEELFTHVERPAARDAFARALWTLAREPAGDVTVVLTLRIDFLGRCGELALDDDGLRLDKVACDHHHQVLVAQMDPAQLLAAIEGPAGAVGVSLEPNLAALIVRDAGAEPGALPLMAHALDQLWRTREGDALTRAAYESLGAVQGALDRHAQTAFDALDPAQQKAARRLLVRLVQPGANGAPDTRRRRLLTELLPEGVAREHARRALDALVAARLVVAGEAEGGATAEIAHEALLRAWRSLRAWIDDARARLAELDRLDGWVREWRRSRDALLTGSRLGYAAEVAGRHPDDVGDDARALIDESRAAVEREAQRLRDALTRANDLALVASARAASDDPTTQVILLRRVERPEVAPRWADLALEALTKPVAERGFDLHPHGGAVEFAVFSPDATRLVTRSEDERVRLWRTDVAGEPVTLSHTGDYEAWPEADRPRYNGFAALTCASFSPDGARLVTGWADGTATVWSMEGKCLRALRGQHTRALTDVTFSPDGARVATASVDGTARVWAVDFDDDPVALRGHTGRVERATFSPDGTLVLTASGDGTACVWPAVKKGEPRVLRGHRDRVTDAIWSPDGARIITVSLDGVLGLWRLDDPSAPAAWNDLETPLRSVSFLPDGHRAVAFPHNSYPRKGPVDGSGPFVLSFNPVEPLAEVVRTRSGACVAISHDGAARLHDSRGEFAPVTLGVPRVLRAAFTADSARVLTVSRDGVLRVWPADGRGALPTWRARGERVIDAMQRGDGLLVVTQRDPEHEHDNPDMCLRVWRPRRSAPLVLAPGYGSISEASLSRDGEQLVACTGREALRWRLAEPETPVTLRGHEDLLETVVFSADGRHVLTASRDATARLWSTATGREVARRAHGGPLSAAALSGDGARALSAVPSAAQAWATDAPEQTLVSYTPQPDVRHVALSDDGQRGASAALRAVHVWRIEPPATEVTLPHADRVGPIAFSPDGTLLVTASDDGAARVWELPAGRERVALRGHEGGVTRVRFSSDGTHVATVSGGGVARLWPVTIPGILARLRAATACELTAAQRTELLGEP